MRNVLSVSSSKRKRLERLRMKYLNRMEGDSGQIKIVDRQEEDGDSKDEEKNEEEDSEKEEEDGDKKEEDKEEKEVKGIQFKGFEN